MNKIYKFIAAAFALAFLSYCLPWHAGAGDSVVDEIHAAGVWDIEGRDQLGTDWIGTLVLKASGRQVFEGHVDWIESEGHCGREYITARFDQPSRRIELSGASTKFANQIARGSYTALLSADGTQLQRGTWGSGLDSAVPGAWQASRISMRGD